MGGDPPRFASPRIFQLVIIALVPLCRVMRGLLQYSNPCTRVFSVKMFRGLRCKSLSKFGLVSEQEI